MRPAFVQPVAIDKVSLEYKASKHGWKSSDFHRCVANKEYLLVIVKSVSGHLFGAFSRKCFRSVDPTSFDEHELDSNAFLFTLTNPHGISPTVLISSGSDSALLFRSNAGPCYGSASALFVGGTRRNSVFDIQTAFSICNQANIHPYSRLTLGGGFIDPTGRGKTLFTGDEYLGLIAEVLAFSVRS
jgi:hypothetical protein